MPSDTLYYRHTGCQKYNILVTISFRLTHGLRMPGEEIALTVLIQTVGYNGVRTVMKN